MILRAAKLCDAYDSGDTRHAWILLSNLPNLLKEAGFMDTRVQVKKVPIGRQRVRLGSKNWDGVYRASRREVWDDADQRRKLNQSLKRQRENRVRAPVSSLKPTH